MYCEYCGSEISENAKFCSNCGAENHPKEKKIICPKCCSTDIDQNTYKCRACGFELKKPAPPIKEAPEDKVSTLAVIGFVLSIILFIGVTNRIILFCVGIPAIVFSILGINDKKYTKRGLATAGLVIAIIAMIIGIFAPPFIKSVNKAKQSQIEVEYRQT